MYKHSDRKKESIHSILLKLLIATQLMFGLGTRHKAQDVVMACEKTEFLFSDISKNNQFIFYFEAQITEQACFSISNQVLWKSLLSNYNIQILEKLKRQRLEYISFSTLLSDIFLPIKNNLEKESLQFIPNI